MNLLLIASLFFTQAMPLEMPRAEAYLVSEDGRRRLEDRYDALDLWMSQTVDGRWADDEGRVFLLATLNWAPPKKTSEDVAKTLTRAAWATRREPINLKKPGDNLRNAIALIAGVALPEEPQKIRQLPRGYKDVRYWQGTNENVIICAYLREKAKAWRLAVWELAEDDAYDAAREAVEDALETKEWEPKKRDEPRPKKRTKAVLGTEERELLRADVRHNVALYENWRVTDSEEFAVIDELGENRAFVMALTNDFARMRKRYAEVLPTPLNGSNTLSVIRIYADRDAFVDALEVDGHTNMIWSAAFWSTSRREIVAYLPNGRQDELRKTLRHEALHQYLAYAASMIPTSPWINEGYAQYFEDEESNSPVADLTPQEVEIFASALPGILAVDYDAFYGGSDASRRAKYHLAHAIAVFLEKGAPKVRFEPFKNVKKDYFAALLETRDMQKATLAAFKDADTLKLFAAEFKKFYLK